MSKTDRMPRVKHTDHRTPKHVNLPLVEPVIVSDDELIERLSQFGDIKLAEAERLAQALRGLGMRAVQMCSVCAEPQDWGIPACPNVATVTIHETRGWTALSGGPMRLCLPHSRGEKVYAPTSSQERRR